MNHAITIGGLLLGVGALAGGVTAAFAALSLAAEGMSDAPTADGGKSGCLMLIGGAIVCIGCILGLVL